MQAPIQDEVEQPRLGLAQAISSPRDFSIPSWSNKPFKKQQRSAAEQVDWLSTTETQHDDVANEAGLRQGLRKPLSIILDQKNVREISQQGTNLAQPFTQPKKIHRDHSDHIWRERIPE